MVRHGRPLVLPLYKVQPADFEKRHAIYNEMSYGKTSVRLHTSLTPPPRVSFTPPALIHTSLITPSFAFTPHTALHTLLIHPPKDTIHTPRFGPWNVFGAV